MRLGLGLLFGLGVLIATAPAAIAAPARAARAPIELGQSVQGRPIHVHAFGDGPVKRLLIGGIHGGYEINTVRLMSRTIEHLVANPGEIPADVTLFIIPNLNPDGAAAGVDRVHGRTNANKVDLNRNWDYAWQARAFHGFNAISGGSEPFSEPETRIARDFIADNDIDAVIFYHSAYGAIFSGAGTTSTRTIALSKLMARATGYRYLPNGVPGQRTTGAATDYLTAVEGITAIDIELLNKADIDWRQNLAGLRAFLRWNLGARNLGA